MSRALGTMAWINPAAPNFDALPIDAEVTFMPLETVWADGKADTSRRTAKSIVANGYTRFDSGDILLPKVTPTFEAGRTFPVELETDAGAGSTELHVVRAKPGFDARYLAYVCRSLPFLQEGATTLEGVGNLRRVPASFVRKFNVSIEDPTIQMVIADYLDASTAKIDMLIEKERQLITALRARRSSAIAHGIAGSDQKGQTKFSGLPWLGYVPTHWAVGNIRRFATMKTGHTPSRSTPEYWTDTTIPWITLADVWQLRNGRSTHVQETAGKISELGMQNSAAELLPAGTVILSRTASVGFAGIMPEPMATSQDYWNWICGPRLLPAFLLYVFRAMRQEFNALSAGSTHKTIYKDDAASFRIPVPPIDEQREIVEHLGQETARIDTLIDKSERMIELSLERRAALITAAVTGQIDVAEMKSCEEAA